MINVRKAGVQLPFMEEIAPDLPHQQFAPRLVLCASI